MKAYITWGLMATAAILLPAQIASARQYYTVADWAHINGGASSTSYITGAWADGRTLYSSVSSPGRLTKTSNLTQTLDGNTSGETYSELTSNAQLSAAGVGQSTGTGGTVNVISLIYGFSVYQPAVGNKYIQFSETSSDSVYRVDTTTGAIARYVSRDDIKTFLNTASTPNLPAGNSTAPDGEFVVYESTSSSFLKTSGAGQVQTFISKADLDTFAAGSGSIAAFGVTFDSANNFYFFSNPATASQKGIYMRTPGGSISQILSYAQLGAAAGNASPTFRDMLFAPDGYVYVADNTSNAQGLLRFLPSNPLGSLEYYLSTADLLAGPAGGSNAIQSLSWYDNGAGARGIAFNYSNSTGAKGFYFVPEPASLLLVGLGGLLLRRRRAVAA